MAVRTPVVATSAGAVPEVVDDAARLVPVGDVDAFTDALGTVLGDDAVAAALVAAGTARAARFRWDHTVDGLAELYGRAVAARVRWPRPGSGGVGSVAPRSPPPCGTWRCP